MTVTFIPNECISHSTGSPRWDDMKKNKGLPFIVHEVLPQLGISLRTPYQDKHS